MGEVIHNGQIERTMLGVEDHGIFTCMVYLNYGYCGQGFGGYCFDSYDKEAKKRVGTGYGIDFIAGLLKAVGVDSWEKLPGKYCRIKHDGPGLSAKIISIGHIVEDKWFSPADLVVK